MILSRYRSRIILVTLLLAVGGIGAKFCLSVAQGFHRAGLAIGLGEAIIKGDLGRMKALLQAGADPNAADIDDSLLLATARGDRAMVRLLLKYGADPSQSLLSVSNVAQAQAMLRLGANVNARTGYMGDTPLIRHATGGNVELVRFLLHHGADATIKSQRGKTVLEMVAYAAGNHPERAAQYQSITKMLQQATARPSPRPGE